MKFSIEKHQQHLTNRLASIARDKESMARRQERIVEAERQAKFLAAQIELAKKDKKDGFDDERYGFTRLLNI